MARRPLQRSIGFVVLAVAALFGALGWALTAASAPHPGQTHYVQMFGLWRVAFNTQGPSRAELIFAILGVLAIAGVVALIEARVASNDRRSLNDTSTPLSPRLIMAETRGVFHGPVTVTVLVPAYNEEASLPDTLRSLKAQSHPPERIIVVADNCTDRTVELALAAGVEVFETVNNTKKKAGGLNQCLRRVLPNQGLNDVVMIMDADTQLDDGFLEAAVDRFTRDRALMAVGGLFYGEEGHGILGQMQRNEYIRYSRDLKRRRGQVFVLTGTASLFRPHALRTVAAMRGTRIPGVAGDVYDTLALTEDNELTIALKSLGALIISPPECTVVTELMPNWTMLWKQRLRWQRGALENIGAYSITPQTFRYWSQQIGIGYGVVAITAYLVVMALLVLASPQWVWLPFWLAIGLMFSVERVITAWKGGWRARLLAAVLIPELVFAIFLEAVWVRSILDIARGRQASWSHVDHSSQGAEG